MRELVALYGQPQYKEFDKDRFVMKWKNLTVELKIKLK